MYFWGTVAVLFVLVCVMGWRMDRKHGSGINGRHDSVDAPGYEQIKRNPPITPL